METFIDDLRLDVIATYDKHEQEWFSCGVQKEALESEGRLIDYIKKQLKYKDLVKLSLCWYCDQSIVDEYETIQDSIEKNAKYYFN